MSIDPLVGDEQAVLDAAARDAATPPEPALGGPDAPAGVPVVPESRLYRTKMRLLGSPLATESLEHQRLGKPTALAVFASDNLSSAAYATEEILRILVPAIGVAAFSLVVPVTTALLVVLGFLILSYRQTIREYPSAGGAYVVTKDNLGKVPSLVAGVSLLTDYILTVAVSVAAGTAALASAVPSLVHVEIPLSILFVAIIAYGNLRGVKESGRVFAIPTYFFLVNMAVLLGLGISRMYFGHLPVDSLHANGLVKVGTAGNGLLYGAALFVVLRAFASGGAAVTGVEAISNGVPAFREPAWKNARTTLVIMGSTLGVMFLGLSMLAAHMHVSPFERGTPTVISQVGKLIYGTTPLGHTLFYLLQIGTLLILILAANTSFADFPRLASFAAADHFMPRQLTKRGHRLVFSNGILMLAGAAIVVLLATEAKVDRLIPLYAIGVFTSFTLSQIGMAKHHIRRKEPGWRRGLFINGTGAVMTAVVDVIIAVTKFSKGAWVIILLVPILVVALLRLNRAYTTEAEELLTDAKLAAEAPILRRHVVLVFLGSLDLAGARALQYARALTPDEMRAVHFAVDIPRANALRLEWLELGLTRIPLEIVACEDRRITRAAVETVAETLADGKTEVTILLPRIEYNRPWHRILHDRTSRSIASVLSDLPHANVTFVPYQLGPRRRLHFDEAMLIAKQALADHDDEAPVAGPVVPIDHARARHTITVAGKVHSLRVQPRAEVATLECTLRDESGTINLVFLGRKHVAGIEPGTRLVVTGMVGRRQGRLEIINPDYELRSP